MIQHRPTTDYTHGLVPGCTVQAQHTGTWVEPHAWGAAYERHKREWRPSHTSEHPAAKETNLNSGGTATRAPDVDTEARTPRGVKRNGGMPYAGNWRTCND